MLNKKEIIAIIVTTIILGFAISLLQSFETFLYTSAMVLIIILLNTFAKKISSFYLDSKIEVGIWEMKRYWYRSHDKLKKPFPIGAFLPIITTILSLGYFVWMASLVFDVKTKVHRAAKRYGLYTFSEMTEYHMGIIAATGVAVNLIFAIIGYLIGLHEFARLNIYFAFFNMIPLGNLDGNKIFFGNLVMWSFLAIVTLIALGYAIFLV